MLCSPNSPIIENSANIVFVPMIYTYNDLYDQMKQVRLSPWINKWSQVIDSTPDWQDQMSSQKNWSINTAIQWDFIPPLGWAEEVFEKVRSVEGR